MIFGEYNKPNLALNKKDKAITKTLATCLILTLLLSAAIMLWQVKPAAALSPGVSWHFDAGSGTTAFDSSPYNNDGTIYGASWTTGKVNSALSFDGTNDYVQIPHSSSLTGFTSAFTVSAWIQLDNTSRRQAIAQKYDNGGQAGWFIEYDGSRIKMFASADGSNYRNWETYFAPTVGQWYHIAVVWVANQVPTFYIDGQAGTTWGSNTISSIYNNSGTPLYIGKCPYASRYFDGKIDEMKIYSQALSAQEVAKEAEAKTTYIGLSGYVTSPSALQSIIDVMNDNGFNIYRMSFNPQWGDGDHPYNSTLIQYFLDHCDYTLIVDPNHLYPASEASAQSARDNWATVEDSLFDVLEAWPNNPRVMVELINEYVSSDFGTRMQNLTDLIRTADYTNGIVANKYAQNWNPSIIDDALNQTFHGMHFYFNSWSVSGAMTQMGYAQAYNVPIINTEIGADYNEYGSFSESEVDEVSDFLAQTYAEGIGNCIWMNENLSNWDTYVNLGLVLPQ